MDKISMDLDGNWEFKPASQNPQFPQLQAFDQWLPATVPNSIYTCLIDVGRIDPADLYPNPEKYDWISRAPWRFRKKFIKPKTSSTACRTDLVCEGLDTFAEIFLNGRSLAKTDNMFLTRRIDVTDTLKEGENILEIVFQPALDYCDRMRSGPVDFTKFPFIYPHRVYARKAQCQFGWDWCPPLPGCGIWRSVRMETVSVARLAHCHFRTLNCSAENAAVSLDIEIERIENTPCECRVELSRHNQAFSSVLRFPAGQTRACVNFDIPRPALWWPASYGPQNLYTLKILLTAAGNTLEQIETPVGIRTVRLKQKSDQHGPDFQFVVNGQPVHARGANWIPPSLFIGSASPGRYKDLLTSAKNANLNILRVWGGGVYESREFYEHCDRLGLMVWQDFTFACAYYPDDPPFLDRIRAEALDNIRRLRNHPSLVLWCGNNEIEWMHNEGWLGGDGTFHGRTIWHDLLPALVAEHHPDAPFIPSSPVLKEGAGKGREHIAAHCWHVWSLHEPIRAYLYPGKTPPRFVAEFGMQALPNRQALSKIVPLDAGVSDYRLEKHNYQIDGPVRVHKYNAEYFAPPKDLETFIYQSQVTQARGIRTHVEHLRANHTVNRGAIFWQWQDCWPAVTWSALDWNLDPKALWYYARRFYAPRLLTVLQTALARFEKTYYPYPLGIVAVNDTPDPLDARVLCSLIDLTGNSLEAFDAAVSVPPFAACEPLSLPQSMITPADPRRCALLVELRRGDTLIARTLWFYLPDKYLHWPEPHLECRLTRINSLEWTATLTAAALLRDLQLQSDTPAALSDNFIDLLPQSPAVITLQTRQPVDSLSLKTRAYRFERTFDSP